MHDFDEIADIVSRLNREKKTKEAALESMISIRDEIEKELSASKEAQAVIQAEAKDTQSELEDYLSGVVTLALGSVEVDDARVPKPPQFLARMVERRGTTECDLLFKEGDREQHPLDCAGGGMTDIADYALRVAYIGLEIEYVDESIRKTLLLDEPFRNVDPAMQFKVSAMLNVISKELGYQHLVVSHADGVNAGADREFRVTKKGGISSASEIT